MPWKRIGAVDDLSPGKALDFEVRPARGDHLAQNGFVLMDGDFPRAYANCCPHRGVELNWNPGQFLNAEGTFIQCATHGALFKVSDGRCIAGPCLGEFLEPIEARLNGNAIEVLIPGLQEQH